MDWYQCEASTKIKRTRQILYKSELLSVKASLSYAKSSFVSHELILIDRNLFTHKVLYNYFCFLVLTQGKHLSGMY